MQRMRGWSVRHARGLKALYTALERTLVFAHPLMRRIGYERLDKPFLVIEKMTKGILLDSQSCGKCVVGSTGVL